MLLWRQVALLSLFGLTLLAVACQTQPGETKGGEQQPPGGGRETSVSQATAPSATSPPTATPIHSLTPSPTPTNAPTASPTNTALPLPTPTAIPVNAPTPSATNIPVPALDAAPAPDEVDLATLEESLAVLDRVDKRAGPTSTPIRPMIFKGAVSYVDWTDVCTRRDIFDGMIFTVVVSIGPDGNVSGTLDGNGRIEFTGTRDSISGERIYDPKCPPAYCTKALQARLTNNDQTFEGTIEETCTRGDCIIASCTMELGRSWEQCGWDQCGGLWTFSLPRK
jgi:hypothetical protein